MLNEIPWGYLIAVAVLLGLAPFGQTPHLVEKLGMLHRGTLKRPIDIFDMLLHLSPFFLMAVKAYGQFAGK